MLSSLLLILIGAFLGWFFIPQPAFAKALFDKLIAKVPALAKYAKTETKSDDAA